MKKFKTTHKRIEAGQSNYYSYRGVGRGSGLSSFPVFSFHIAKTVAQQFHNSFGRTLYFSEKNTSFKMPKSRNTVQYTTFPKICNLVALQLGQPLIIRVIRVWVNH